MSWVNFEEMFSAINSKCNYLVIRNYEYILSTNVLGEHDDIDFLCDDKVLFFKTIKAFFPYVDDDIHCETEVGGQKYRIDIRCIGDSYFDVEWQKNMLKNRKLYNNTIYVMDDIDYYYSIGYHEVYHKNEMRDDYLSKMKELADINGLVFNRDTIKESVDEFLKKNKYRETGYRSKCKMGELICKLGEITIGDSIYSIELNEPVVKNGEQMIHIQSKKFRFECKKSEFLTIAGTILFAEKNFDSYKE